MMRFFTAIAALAAAAFVAGCSRPPAIVPASGVLLLNGEPLPYAFVQFVPIAEGVSSQFTASGTSDETGRFELTCNGQPGACACECMVLVSDAPLPGEVRGNQTTEARHAASLKNRPIPAKYHNTTKNPLRVTVTAGQSEYKLELTR